MQRQSEAITIFIMAIAFAFVFYLLPYVVKSMPDWIAYSGLTLCGIVIAGCILALTPAWNKIFKRMYCTPLIKPELRE